MESNLDQHTRADMKKGAAWIKFVAVVMMAFATLIIVFGLIGMAGGRGTAGIGLLIVLALGGLFSFIGYQLLLYSNSLSQAGETATLRPLERGFVRLKTYYIFVGIISILSVLLKLYQFIA